MEITCRVYRPRRARESPLFRLVEQHLEEFLRVYQERFAKSHGPLRPVVERVLRAFLTCGLVERGFARAWCGTCRLSYLIPYSCRGRSFCPSCEKKRSLLWAEWLREEVLAPVPHRHVVLTMPRLLRGIFRKRRELLLDLSQCGAEALSEYMRREVGADARPGIVVSIATAGDLLQWHVHLHVLSTDELMAWRHPGFSAHVADPISAEDTQALENLAGYVTRTPLSLQRLVYLDGQQAVIYKALQHNPSLGRNFETMHPLEWLPLARMADHIPDPGEHRTLSYGY